MEYEFLFQHSTKSQLAEILKTLFYQLKFQHASFLPLQCQTCNQQMDVVFHYIATQILKSPAFPVPNHTTINDFDVPMFRSEKINFSNLPWDISFQHIVLYIDGISHVRKIAKEAVMDLDMVKKALSLLAFHGAVVVADIFRFSNIYTINEDLYSISPTDTDGKNVGGNNLNSALSDRISSLSDPAFLSELRDFACMGYIAAYSSNNTVNSVSTPGNPTTTNGMKPNGTAFGETHTTAYLYDIPSFSDIVDFLLQLQSSKSIAQILLSSIPFSRGYPIRSNRSRANSRNFDGDSAEVSENDQSEHGLPSDCPLPTSGAASTSNGNNDLLNHCFMKRLKNLDIARLLAYAQMKGLIRRVHEYPIYVPTKGELVPHPYLSDSPGGLRPLGYGSRDNSNPNLDSPSSTDESGKDGDITDIKTADSSRNFSKLARTRTVVSKAFLRDATSANTAANSRCKSSHHSLQSIPEIVQLLDGCEHLDSICCRYDVNALDLVSYSGVYILYK